MMVGEHVGEFIGLTVNRIAASNRRALLVSTNMASWPATWVEKGFGGWRRKVGRVGGWHGGWATSGWCWRRWGVVDIGGSI